ncbi:suppressor of lurcher protein 1-like [Anabrus simplex]|uniref:suppressor of lurcher protein 1-like n=1 Tax=Anabrus simplex TaxID=316456 RepID=UPI0035A3453C
MEYSKIIFQQHNIRQRRFSRRCECLVFSTTYGKEYGTFSSPDYPRPYQDNINCLLYTFIASLDHIVQITFKDFDVQKSHLDCARGDYVKLFLHLERPEVNEYTPWAGLLCGGYTDIPHVLYSSGRGLVLEFHSDHRPANSSGFLGHFRFIDRRMFQTDGQKLPGTMCDHQFISSNYSLTHGRFYSPRYPSSYPRNIKCAYRFRGRLKERIRVVFEEVRLQHGDVSCLNRADVIKVWDGRSSLAPAITVLCNEGSELEVLSTGPDLYIEFLANSEWPGQGFKANFQFQPGDFTISDIPSTDQSYYGYNKVSAENEPAVSATTSACDVVLNSDSTKSGLLTSPGYPGPYPARSHCRYDFQGRGKERIQVVFNDFRLYHPTDNSRECESIDSLMAYVHIDGHMEKIDSFCGSAVPKPLMSNGPRLLLEFRGIYSSSHTRGFKATYAFTENFGVTSGRQLVEFPCAFVFNSSEEPRGSFASPNFPGVYPRDTECHYFFQGKPREKVHLHFHYFDVEGVLPCEAVSASDYVEFSNYMVQDRKYVRHCGQIEELHVESDRRFFRVTFRSNDRMDGTGFNATYQFLDEVDTYVIKHSERNSATSTVEAEEIVNFRAPPVFWFYCWWSAI